VAAATTATTEQPHRVIRRTADWCNSTLRRSLRGGGGGGEEEASSSATTEEEHSATGRRRRTGASANSHVEQT